MPSAVRTPAAGLRVEPSRGARHASAGIRSDPIWIQSSLIPDVVTLIPDVVTEGTHQAGIRSEPARLASGVHRGRADGQLRVASQPAHAGPGRFFGRTAAWAGAPGPRRQAAVSGGVDGAGRRRFGRWAAGCLGLPGRRARELGRRGRDDRGAQAGRRLEPAMATGQSPCADPPDRRPPRCSLGGSGRQIRAETGVCARLLDHHCNSSAAVDSALTQCDSCPTTADPRGTLDGLPCTSAQSIDCAMSRAKRSVGSHSGADQHTLSLTKRPIERDRPENPVAVPLSSVSCKETNITVMLQDFTNRNLPSVAHHMQQVFLARNFLTNLQGIKFSL